MKKCSQTRILKLASIILFLVFISIFSGCNLDSLQPSLLDRLHKFQYVTVDFGADIESNHEILSFSSLSADNTPPWGSSQNSPLEWDGNTFSVNYDYEDELFSGERFHTYGTIHGTISEDGMTLESMTADETTIYIDEGDVFKDFITVLDVPYDAEYIYDEYTPRYGAEGPGVSNNIYSYSQSWEFVDDNGSQQTLYATTVNYNDPDDIPYLHITFSGD